MAYYLQAGMSGFTHNAPESEQDQCQFNALGASAGKHDIPCSQIDFPE
jgi:hypothetical protein